MFQNICLQFSKSKVLWVDRGVSGYEMFVDRKCLFERSLLEGER